MLVRRHASGWFRPPQPLEGRPSSIPGRCGSVPSQALPVSSRRTVAVALFIGSSNLTNSGFYRNVEINALLQGVPNRAEEVQLKNLRKQLEVWRQNEYSLAPSAAWLRNYRTAFERALRAQKKARISTPAQREEEIPTASWLGSAGWSAYHDEVVHGLSRASIDTSTYLKVLRTSRQLLPLPWKITYFDDLERRKMISGGGTYGWLGHVGASGAFRHMLVSGTRREKRIIVDTINAIAALNPPLDWDRLDRLLRKLVALGPTMKVWSRLLCLVRPDLYCTVSSDSVRKNLSEVLKIPQSSFQTPSGYLKLLKVIHASPWFESSKPMRKKEAEVWRTRAAFLDGAFYT